MIYLGQYNTIWRSACYSCTPHVIPVGQSRFTPAHQVLLKAVGVGQLGLAQQHKQSLDVGVRTTETYWVTRSNDNHNI